MASTNHVQINTSREGLSCAGTAQASAVSEWQPDGPNLRFNEMLRVMRVGKSKAYELIEKVDPAFPKGIPLFDYERSPKVYRVCDALAWIEMRSIKSLNSVGTVA